MQRPLSFFLILFCLNLAETISQTDFDRAVNLFHKEEFDKAYMLFETHLKNNPNNLKAYEYIADIAAHQYNWDLAIERYGALTHKVSHNAEYHYKLGGSMAMKASENRWYALRNYKKIERKFKKVLSLDNQHINSHWALIEYYLQLPAILGGSREKADEYAVRLLQISPVDGYLAKGRIAEYYHDIKGGEKSYKKAIEIGGSVHTYQKLIAFYRKHQEDKKANQLLQLAHEKYPDFKEIN